jgi:hypothetical protein
MLGAIEGTDLATIVGAVCVAVGAISTPFGLLARALLKRMDHQAVRLEQVNRAVNHQADDQPTLIERVIAIEAAATEHNAVAAELGERVGRIEEHGTERHLENTEKFDLIIDRLDKVERAQQAAASAVVIAEQAETDRREHDGS